MHSRKQQSILQAQNLITICQGPRTSRSQIAWLSIKESPILPLHDHIMLLLEYIQFISPILLISLRFKNNQEAVLPEVITRIKSLIDMSSWVPFEKIGPFQVAILSFVGLVMILKYLLFGYIALIARNKGTCPKNWLIQIWQYVFRVQGRVLYFFGSTFWIKAIYAVKNAREEISSSEYYGIMIVSAVMMGLEFILTLMLYVCYIDILPSKQFLSRKDNTVEIIGLIQKLAIQVLVVSLDYGLLSSLWTFTSVNMLMDVMRNVYFYKKLPLYRFKALFYQGSLQMIVCTLNLACFITCILRTIDKESSSLGLMVVLWVILGVLLVKCSRMYLKRRFESLLLSLEIDNSVNLLIHRICAIKELQRGMRDPSKLKENYSWELLVNNSINSKIKEIFKIDSDEEGTPLDINDKESFNKILRSYLEKLMKVHPENKFLKLYTAYFYTKSLKLIRSPIGLLTKLQSNSGLLINLNVELLFMEIQNSIKARDSQRAENTKHLDLSKFLYEKTLYVQAREKIISQADLQIKICNEIKKESPNLSLIYNDSQRLALQRLKTNKFIKSTVELMSDHHIEPLLLYARYHLVLNHSVNESTHYTKLYNQKLQKYHQYFEKDGLVQENMFNQDISFTIFSCSEATLGKVFYASKQFTKMLRRSNDSILAMNIIKNAPPCFRENFVEYYKFVARQGESALRDNQILKGFICDSEHYLLEIDYYIDIHPFATSEFLVTFIQRVFKSSGKDFMLVLENGDIDCTTKGIAEKLGVFPSRKAVSPGTDFNLRDVSEELVGINDAFNMVFFEEKKNDEEVKRLKSSVRADQAFSKAQDIYSIYTTEGQDLALKTHVYNCKVANILLGKSLLKLFTFEERIRIRLNTGDQTPANYGNEPEFNEKDTPETSGHDESATADVAAEEKHEGWIDFEALKARGIFLNSNLGETNRTTTVMETQRGQETCRNLLKPRITDLGDGCESPVMSPQSKKSQRDFMETKFSADSTGGKNGKQTEKKMSRNRGESRGSIATSKWSKFSHQKRISYLYEVSLNTRDSPKLYKVLLCLFLAAFILLTVSQFSLKQTLDNNVEQLGASKDVLRNAQLRNYHQVMIEFTTRILWDSKAGTLSSSALGIFAYMISSFPSILKTYLLQLGESNRNLLSNSSSLNKDIRDQLFATDVKVYETYFDDVNQTYTILNNFQAINSIVETGLRMTNPEVLADLETTEVLANFLFRNCFNDLLVKNEEISQIINSALDSQRKDIENGLKIFLISLLVVFGGLGIFVVFTLWQQYLKQLRNLSALCRVNSERLDEVLSELLRFKQHVEDEEIEYHRHERTPLSPMRRNKVIEKKLTRDPDCWDLQKSYYFLVGKLVFLVLIIMATVIVTSLLNQSSIKSSKMAQGQIYFLDHVKARTGVASGSLLELLSTNNTAFVEGKLVLDELESLMGEIENIRIEITKTFLDSTDTRNFGHFETILYGDACPVLDQTTAESCYIVEKRGYKTGFVYILSSYSTISSAVITKYKDSNKTEEALQGMKEEFFEILVLLQQVIRMELTELGDFIDGKFEEDLASARKGRGEILIGYILLIVCVSFLVWRVVLKRFGEAINEFKNVLSVLPGDLVLASFLLRNFLLKTSKGVLDSIKNDF